MASLNLAGKTSGYVKLQAPDDSSTNPTVTLPTESGELALKSDIGKGGGETTDILPVLYSGVVSSDGVDISATGCAVSKISTGRYQITFDKPLPEDDFYSVSLTGYSGKDRNLTLNEKNPNGFIINCFDTAGDAVSSSVNFSVISNKTIAVGTADSATYSTEEVDKKLAVKDKLIEKLSERLDKLEAKLKK
jgi:hypothetical protein